MSQICGHPRLWHDHDRFDNMTRSLKTTHFVPYGIQRIIFDHLWEKLNSSQLTPPNVITFSPKKVAEICSGHSLGKYFHVFRLDHHRPCLAWPSISVLISQPIYDTFKLKIKWWQSEISSKFVVNCTIEL